jgi:hypothetical protein
MALSDVIIICIASCVAQMVVQCISWVSTAVACANKPVGTEMAKCNYIFKGVFGCINCIICVYAVYRMIQAMKNNV